MTLVRLTKHHGLGNDFLVLAEADLAEADIDRLPELARSLCDRRRGIGADGFMVASHADGFDARMVLYNADGSRAEMSGNGIRCFAQALAGDRAEPSSLRILTDAGERTVELRPTATPRVIEATVGMGEVEPIDPPPGWAELGVHPDRPVAHLSLGNPHTVVGVDDLHAVDLATLGAALPDVNLEIVEPGPGPSEITMRVHERGAGITEACGTGACASAWAAVTWGLVPAPISDEAVEVVVHMDGGSARVLVDRTSAGQTTLTGPAALVARIEVELP